MPGWRTVDVMLVGGPLDGERVAVVAGIEAIRLRGEQGDALVYRARKPMEPFAEGAVFHFAPASRDRPW